MIGQVLGTTIWAASDDERGRTLVLSDLHVPDHGGPVLDRLEQVLDLARRDAADSRVLILGDLFDSYVGPRQLTCGVWRRVAGMLEQTTAAGVSVAVLHGNRDFMLDGRFAAVTGCRVVAGGLRLDVDGRRVLAVHGDELCQNDRPYQRAKRWLRHPVTRWLLRRLPRSMAEAAGRRARRRSRSVIASGNPQRFDPVRQALDAAFGIGADVLVFGHIHRPARGFLEPGREYCVLPAFDEAGVLLVATDGQPLGYRRVEAGHLEPIADPPPREFA